MFPSLSRADLIADRVLGFQTVELVAPALFWRDGEVFADDDMNQPDADEAQRLARGELLPVAPATLALALTACVVLGGFCWRG